MFCFLLLVVALLLVLLSQEKRCAFAHSVAELRPLPNLQRTSICTAWKKGQCCRDICRFAHGAQELCATEGFRKTNMCRHAHGHQELKQPNHALLLAKEEAQQRSSSSLSCRTEAQHNDGEQLATATAAVAATGDNSSSRRSSISGGIRLQQENEEVYQKEQEQQEQQEQQELFVCRGDVGVGRRSYQGANKYVEETTKALVRKLAGRSKAVISDEGGEGIANTTNIK
eukprot:GHVS01107790.1.p1 GENE.GHVS01107790.1~~GHVS01107790.1.p1  ORF type:complete len:228 (+),score=67.94 GHVS01107790.1:201-884(+)